MLEVLRGCRDHQDGCGKTLPLIADGNLPAELKTRGWNTVAGSDPEPRRAFWPRKTGTKGGRSRPRGGFSRVAICSWFQLGSSGAAIACSAVALDREAERKVDRAFWSEGLTGRAFWHDKKSWLSVRRRVAKPISCRRKDGPKSVSRSTSERPAANHFW